ncbi:xanthine dehydrogenase family protein molybdopterin-binding subunit [Candidatus Poriferisocius sp.]|uniref:xanthine dehydrogenase family protein molybdopterin-binding subunit n=1 Tax=Candidatus Poriferisocius sp. TaxID=3101276 RepID=UPI003B59CDF6
MSGLSPRLFGARVPRVEDDRLLKGQGRFVADVDFPGTLSAKFVRSDEASSDICDFDVKEALACEKVRAVFTGDDFAGAEIRCVSAYEGFQPSAQPILAVGRTRYAGEAMAMVVADDEYAAEDAAEHVMFAYRPLEPVAGLDDVLGEDREPVHSGWVGHAFVRRSMATDGFEEAAGSAAHQVTVELRNARHGAIPMEGRACVARYDQGSGLFELWTTTQIPHLIRAGLSDALGVAESRIRVISPDVGGGFGVKAQLYPEEVACCLAARELGRPVKWVEDRREHFFASHHSREHRHRVTGYFNDGGILLALEADIAVDMGAYSVFPWTSTMDCGMAMGILPGPYRVAEYSVTGTAYCTNKAPYGAYRGVARPAACFSIERLMDRIARHRGADRTEIRRRNLIGPDDYPWHSASGLVYDSGSLPESLDKALEVGGHNRLLADQAAARAEGRLFGIGLAVFTEQTAHTTREFQQRGVPIVFGYETAKVRLDATGTAVVSASIHDHGQGLETTLAQIAADRLGLSIEDIRVEYGDTDQVAYGAGTFASRSAVLAGGAVVKAVDAVAETLRQVAAHRFEASPADIVIGQGCLSVSGSPGASIEIAELCRLVYQRPESLPRGVEPILEASRTYDADPGTGVYTNAAHLASVEIDPLTGKTMVLSYAIAEDCGPMINPTIVEGQIFGGVAQGIGTALFEEFVYDDEARLLTTTFSDYLIPTMTDIPDFDVAHLETPSPHTIGGLKGMGEGGAIAPGAAIAAAVEDALSAVGDVFVDQLPLTPERVLAWLNQARIQGDGQ